MPEDVDYLDDEFLYRGFKGVNIDDFLHHYRPQICHVQHFISMPADLGSDSAQVDTELIDRSHCSTIIATSIQRERLEKSTLDYPRKLQQHCRSKPAATLCTSTKKIAVNNIKIYKSSSSRALKKKLSHEEKAEHRREQNREAQRRFREKRMILSWRSLACPDDLSWPLFSEK